jgi:cell division protein FtsN
MKQRDRKPFQFSPAVAVRLQGYARRPRRYSPWLRLGAMALIVFAVAFSAVFRHLSHGSGEGSPFAAAPPKDDAAVAQPEPPPSRSTSVSPPEVSTNLLIPTEPSASVAPPTRPEDNAASSQAPDITTHSVAKPPKENSVPVPTPNPSAVSSVHGHPAAVQGSGGRRYHVQVGALADKAAAEELAGRVRVLGYAVRVVGAQPFLVWVGGYLDEPTAGRLLSHLRGQGFDAVLHSGGTGPL